MFRVTDNEQRGNYFRQICSPGKTTTRKLCSAQPKYSAAKSNNQSASPLPNTRNAKTGSVIANNVTISIPGQ
jgi:hypothetical protein